MDVLDSMPAPPEGGDPVIEVAGLVKSFGRFPALDGLDLQVERGEVHGFLGPNGAGKSTTIRVLLGLLKADAGTVRLLGGDPWRDVVGLHRRLAYVPGDVSLWPGMTGGEAIDLLGTLRGGLDERRRAELIERFELDPTKRGRQYSKGNRQKVALVAALASDVELLILDEPTSGLDPLMENVFQEEIARRRPTGAQSCCCPATSSAEVEALADRLSIIRDGRDRARPARSTQLRGRTRTTIHAVFDRLPARLATLRRAAATRGSTGRRLSGVRRLRPASAPRWRELSRYGITSLTVAPPSLESLFLRHVRARRRPRGDAVSLALDRRRARCCAPRSSRTAAAIAPWIVLDHRAVGVLGARLPAGLSRPAQDRAGLAAAVGSNPALGLIFGPARDLITVDGFNAWRSLALGGFLAALMAIFAVIRDSRAQEDSGQAELLASGVLGRGRPALAVAIGHGGARLAARSASCRGLVTVACGGGWADSLLLSATLHRLRLDVHRRRRRHRPARLRRPHRQLDRRRHRSASLFMLRGFLYAVQAAGVDGLADPAGLADRDPPRHREQRVAAAARRRPRRPARRGALALHARRDFGLGAIAPRPRPARARPRTPPSGASRCASTGVADLLAGRVRRRSAFVFGSFATSVDDLLARNAAVSSVLAAGATTTDAAPVRVPGHDPAAGRHPRRRPRRADRHAGVRRGDRPSHRARPRRCADPREVPGRKCDHRLRGAGGRPARQRHPHRSGRRPGGDRHRRRGRGLPGGGDHPRRLGARRARPRRRRGQSARTDDRLARESWPPSP